MGKAAYWGGGSSPGSTLLPHGREEKEGRGLGPAIAYLLSFICVYRGWGSGSWSLTSKLAPGSWRGHGHRQEQSDHSGRPAPP